MSSVKVSLWNGRRIYATVHNVTVSDKRPLTGRTVGLIYSCVVQRHGGSMLLCDRVVQTARGWEVTGLSSQSIPRWHKGLPVLAASVDTWPKTFLAEQDAGPVAQVA